MSRCRSFRELAAAGRYHELVAQLPYAAYLGVAVETTDAGRRYRMPFREMLLGNAARGSLHGGAIAGFAESAALIEVSVAQRQNRIPKPVDFSIDYLRRGQSKTCYATAVIVREGRRVVLASVECWQDSPDTPIAQARMHLLLEPPPA